VHLTFVNLGLTDSTLSYERLAAAAFDAYLETKGLRHSVAVWGDSAWQAGCALCCR
jgi:hypothetical protein